jgi:tRNA (uracil-5-)-methyltransferase TRM9
VEAVKAILDLLRPPSSQDADEIGKALIYVWALEQKDSRRGWDEGHEQDVMVPWVLKEKKEKVPKKKGARKGNAGGMASVEKAEAENERAVEPKQPEEKTFLRYYHLYRKGELEHDIDQAGGRVIESGYEKDNWWAIAMPKAKT